MLTVDIVSPSRKIGSYIRRLHKLVFNLENKNTEFRKFCGNLEILLKLANFVAWPRIPQPTENCSSWLTRLVTRQLTDYAFLE